jgi:endonuclease YncB( thermonuclease family)
MLKFIASLGLLAEFVLSVQPTDAVDATVSCTIRVIDGYTIDVNGTRIRMFGIDAPEGNQTCTDTQDRVVRCGDWVPSEVGKAYQGQWSRCQRIDTDR